MFAKDTAMILVIVQLALLAAVIIIGLFFLWKSIRRLDDKLNKVMTQVSDVITNAVPVAMTRISAAAGGAPVDRCCDDETCNVGDDFEIILERKPTPPRQQEEDDDEDGEDYDADYEEDFEQFDMFDTLAKTILKAPIFVPATNVAAKIEEIVEDNNEVVEVNEVVDNEVPKIEEIAEGVNEVVEVAEATESSDSAKSAYSAKRLGKMRVEELHTVAEKLNLSVDGSKKVIIQRILDSQK